LADEPGRVERLVVMLYYGDDSERPATIEVQQEN
jgi:hypothetical protein